MNVNSHRIAALLLETAMEGYLAVVLTPESRTELLQQVPAKHANVFAHHLTIAFKPDESVYSKYANLVGETTKMTITGEASDEQGQAVLVEGPSENPNPHITISCAPGVKPAYSNTLLQQQRHGQVHFLRLEPFTVYGQVQFIPFKAP